MIDVFDAADDESALREQALRERTAATIERIDALLAAPRPDPATMWQVPPAAAVQAPTAIVRKVNSAAAQRQSVNPAAPPSWKAWVNGRFDNYEHAIALVVKRLRERDDLQHGTVERRLAEAETRVAQLEARLAKLETKT